MVLKWSNKPKSKQQKVIEIDKIKNKVAYSFFFMKDAPIVEVEFGANVREM